MADQFQKWVSFGIAQVLPGLLIMFGMSFHSAAVKEWFGLSATSPITVGGTVFIVLAATFCGLVLSGARYLVFERALGLGKDRPAYGPRVAPGVEAACQAASFAHYPYFQFYGSTAIALPIFLALWIDSMGWSAPALTIGLAGGAAIEYVLVASAKDAMRRLLDKQRQLLAWPPQQAST